MKKIILILLAVLVAIPVSAQKKKIYLNPGHGGWGPDDRPLPTIPYPMLASTGRPDTCGFYESNTNLWKALECGARLAKNGNFTVKFDMSGSLGPDVDIDSFCIRDTVQF